MRCGFRPHDRDRNDREHGGEFAGFWATLEGCWAAHKRSLTVTRLTVGVSNDLQMARNLTGGLPVLYQGRLARLGPFRERLTPAH